MADAAEEIAGLPERAIRLKWPNDLVVQISGPDALLLGELDPDAAARRLAAPIEIRKLGGVLGETDAVGTVGVTAVVGIGVNADWPAETFPPELAGSMTSLREASGGRPIDLALLLDAFTARLEPRILALRGGRFDVGDWVGRQLTRGLEVTIRDAAGDSETVRALGVDSVSGALVVEDPAAPTGERHVLSGEITRLRVASPATAVV
jgi:biotin-(acetyl-CoA carboxylase) ligase